jgi:hypothetical protein
VNYTLNNIVTNLYDNRLNVKEQGGFKVPSVKSKLSRKSDHRLGYQEIEL